MEFENLEPETTYRVQIYGFTDRDYDNYIELGYVKADGTYVPTIQSDKQEEEIAVSDFYEGIYSEVTEDTPDSSRIYYVKKDDGMNVTLIKGVDYKVGDGITSADNNLWKETTQHKRLYQQQIRSTNLVRPTIKIIRSTSR